MFYIIILIQAVLAAFAFYAGQKRVSFFALSSIAITSLLLLVIEIKPHHYIRNNYGIPNTLFYLISLILLLIFFWYFRELVMQNQYYLLILTALLWTVSGAVDLLSDRGMLSISGDIYETALTKAGSITYLLFYILLLFQNRRIIKAYNK